MKKFASFLAAATIVFTGAGGLAADVHAAAMSAPRATVSTVSASSSSSGKTLYQELLKKGYIITGNSNKKETTNTKQVVKSTKASKKNKKSNSSLYDELIRNGGYIVDNTDDTEPSNDNTSSSSSTSTVKNNVQMTDYYGNKLSSSMYVSYNGLTANQQYIYNTIKAAVDKGSTVAKLKKGYNRKDVEAATASLASDYSYMVWVKYYSGGSRDKNGKYTSVKIVYDTNLNKDRAATMQLMNDYLKPMLDKASKLSTDVEKVKYVHDWLIYSVKDGSDKSNSKSTDMHYHRAYAAIVEKKGVCEAYSSAFVYCMQKLGIQAANVLGTTWNGGDHVWNIVKVGGDWYEVDVYWDDLITKSETDYTYTCFMQTTASMKEYDSYNGVSRKRDDYCDYLPTAYGTKYSPENYSYSNGTDFTNLPKVVITKTKTDKKGKK